MKAPAADSLEARYFSFPGALLWRDHLDAEMSEVAHLMDGSLKHSREIGNLLSE